MSPFSCDMDAVQAFRDHALNPEHPANQFYNYEFATVNGALRGNGNYHIFIKLGSGGTVGYDYASGTPFATWQSPLPLSAPLTVANS